MLLPERRLITITADAKAPLKLKRWFFAMLQLLCEATGRWPTPEIARKEIMIRTGFFESMHRAVNDRLGPARVACVPRRCRSIRD
jgi:hypothetical protein